MSSDIRRICDDEIHLSVIIVTGKSITVLDIPFYILYPVQCGDAVKIGDAFLIFNGVKLNAVDIGFQEFLNLLFVSSGCYAYVVNIKIYDKYQKRPVSTRVVYYMFPYVRPIDATIFIHQVIPPEYIMQHSVCSVFRCEYLTVFFLLSHTLVIYKFLG